MEEGGFTLVRRRKGGRRAAPRTRAEHSVGDDGDSDAEPEPEEVARQAARLDEAVRELRASALWRRVRALVPALGVHELVCLGIGSFSRSTASRYQLALALLLRDEIRTPSDSGAVDAPAGEARPAMSVYDPVLSALERQCLAGAGCALLQSNDEGRCVASVRTLYFMPHCGRQLYSNLLRANWGREGLQRCAVLGNSFGAYAAALSDARTDAVTSWCALARATCHVEEVNCGEEASSGAGAGRRRSDETFDNAFNNLSLHTFAGARLPPDDDACWARAFDPPPPNDPLANRDIVASGRGHAGCCC